MTDVELKINTAVSRTTAGHIVDALVEKAAWLRGKAHDVRPASKPFHDDILGMAESIRGIVSVIQFQIGEAVRADSPVDWDAIIDDDTPQGACRAEAEAEAAKHVGTV